MNMPHFLMLLAMVEGAVMLTLPHYSPRKYFFAITVAPEFRESTEARVSLWRYRGWVAAATVAAMAGSAFFLSPVLLVVVAMGAFLRERSVTRRHATPLPAMREAEVASEGAGLPVWTVLPVMPIAALAAVGVYLSLHWAEIPARFPIHWGANGEPNGWATRSVRGVHGPLLFGGGMIVLMMFLGIANFYGARRGPQRVAVLKVLIAVTFLLGGLFSGVALLPVSRLPLGLFLWLPLVFVIVVLVWTFRMVRTQPAESTPDECWKMGSLYYNPADAAIFVQKRIGFGYTFNFGNKLTWVILGAFAAGMIGLVFVLPR